MPRGRWTVPSRICRCWFARRRPWCRYKAIHPGCAPGSRQPRAPGAHDVQEIRSTVLAACSALPSDAPDATCLRMNPAAVSPAEAVQRCRCRAGPPPYADHAGRRRAPRAAGSRRLWACSRGRSKASSSGAKSDDAAVLVITSGDRRVDEKRWMPWSARRAGPTPSSSRPDRFPSVVFRRWRTRAGAGHADRPRLLRFEGDLGAASHRMACSSCGRRILAFTGAPLADVVQVVVS